MGASITMAPILLALRKPLPTAEDFAEAFDDFDGTLAGPTRIGETTLAPLPPDPAAEARFARALEAEGYFPLRNHQIFSVEPGDDGFWVASTLIDLCGGAYLGHDDEVLQHCGVRQGLTKKRKRRKTDVSIPALVMRQFGESQAQYCLYPRVEPTVQLPRLVKAAALPVSPSRPKYAGTTRLLIGVGHVHLNAHDETEHWKSEFVDLGQRPPPTVYRTSFEHWHVTSVPQEHWLGMLRIVCGLARHCDGILYRPSSSVRFDFTRPEAEQDPNPTGPADAVAATLMERARTARGAMLAEALEGLARIKWTAALTELDFDELCRRTDRNVVESVWKFLKR